GPSLAAPISRTTRLNHAPDNINPGTPGFMFTRASASAFYPSPLQPDNQAEQQQAGNPHPLLGHAIDWRPNAENFLVEFQAGLGSRTAERDAVDQHLAVLFVGHQAYLLQFFLARLAIRNRQQQAELARITNGIFAADAQAQLAVLVYRFQSLDPFRRREVLVR